MADFEGPNLGHDLVIVIVIYISYTSKYISHYSRLSLSSLLPNDSKGVPLPCSLTCHVWYAADMAYQTGPGQDQACSAKQPAEDVPCG